MLALPFNNEKYIQSFNDRRNRNFDLFKLYSPQDSLLPFFCKIPSTNFDVVIYNEEHHEILRYNSVNFKHKIIRSNGIQLYCMYEGGKISCLNLDCGWHYIKIGDLYSEPFYCTNISTFTKIESFSSENIGDVPYKIGFKQHFYIKGDFSAPILETKNIIDEDSRGFQTKTYTLNKSVYSKKIYDVQYFQYLYFKHLESCDTVNVTGNLKSFSCLPKTTQIKEKKDDSFKDLYEIDLQLYSLLNEINHFVDNYNYLSSDNIFVEEKCKEENLLTVNEVDCQINDYSDVVVTVIVN